MTMNIEEFVKATDHDRINMMSDSMRATLYRLIRTVRKPITDLTPEETDLTPEEIDAFEAAGYIRRCASGAYAFIGHTGIDVELTAALQGRR